MLSVVPVPGSDGTGKMKWPLIPAAVLGVLGVIFALQSVVLPIAEDLAVLTVVIVTGIGLLVYGYRARNTGHDNKVHGP